jgi:hypothetical protein
MTGPYPRGIAGTDVFFGWSEWNPALKALKNIKNRMRYRAFCVFNTPKIDHRGWRHSFGWKYFFSRLARLLKGMPLLWDVHFLSNLFRICFAFTHTVLRFPMFCRNIRPIHRDIPIRYELISFPLYLSNYLNISPINGRCLRTKQDIIEQKWYWKTCPCTPIKHQMHMEGGVHAHACEMANISWYMGVVPYNTIY